ncbi:MAG: hypothetical protein OCU18_03965 [Candidatus Syntrophoarchaeum sp.]|nr:hypothetical protein [Candidatus Syntrophoarchaeum sp.]
MSELTGKKADRIVSDWNERIRVAYRLRKNNVKYGGKSVEDIYRDARKYYRGDWKSGIIPVNRMFSFGRSLIPSVFFRAPRITVTATKPNMSFHARIVEEIDNFIIQETNLKQTLKLAALNTYLYGWCPIKLGYDSEFGYISDQATLADNASITQFATQGEDYRNIEYRTNIKRGFPWALQETPENIIVPFEYRSFDSLPWIAHRITRPLEDVRQDRKYRNTKDLQGTRVSFLTEQKDLSAFRESQTVPFAELFEIRDLSRQMVYVICEDRLLLAENDVLQFGSLPWEILVFNEDPEYFGGIPDTVMLEPQQIELNEIRTQASRHRKIALLKFLYKKGAITEDELEKFFSGEVGPGVGVDDDVLSNAITAIQPHIPADLASEALQVKSDLRETMGFSENQLGAFSPFHNKTATETMQVAETYHNRVNERKDIIADCLISIVRKWNNFIFRFWEGERVAKITGKDGAEQWVTFTTEQLRGEYQLRIDPDTGFPASKALKQQASDMIFKACNGDPLIDQIALRKMYLQNFEWLYPGISNIVREVPPAVASQAASIRQPMPAGSGSGGGMGGRSPANPVNFEDARARFEKEQQ